MEQVLKSSPLEPCCASGKQRKRAVLCGADTKCASEKVSLDRIEICPLPSVHSFVPSGGIIVHMFFFVPHESDCLISMSTKAGMTLKLVFFLRL